MGLEDVPDHRREALLWHYALKLDYEGVNDLVTHNTGGICRTQWKPAVDPDAFTAVRGDDGRYHLLHDGRATCGEEQRRGDLPALIRHRDWCHWWADGQGYRIQAPPDAWSGLKLARGVCDSRDHEWSTTLTTDSDEPSRVPLRSRCPSNARLDWPGYQGSDSRAGRQRTQLIAALGNLCSACKCRLGSTIDHDHFNGLVRGLLCGYCNSHVDKCMHPHTCPFAEYLNAPPAQTLRLRYFRHERVGRTATDILRIEFLGFDPLYRGPRDQRRRYPPRDLPPPPHGVLDFTTAEHVPLF